MIDICIEGEETLSKTYIMTVKLSQMRGKKGAADHLAGRGRKGEAGGSVIRGRGRLGMWAFATLVSISPPCGVVGQERYPVRIAAAHNLRFPFYCSIPKHNNKMSMSERS